MNMTKPLIIAVVGMTGSGKSEAAEFFKTKGYTFLRFGSAVDDEITNAGYTWSPEWTAHFRKKVRDDLGMAGVAIKMLPKIQEALTTSDKVLLDGLYSWEEYVYLQDYFPDITLLCVYARSDIRYARLANRPERPFTAEEAKTRDMNEIVVTNKGGPIAFAHYLIKNETTKEEFTKELEGFLLWTQTK
jgi:dephospho-CoA kinase